MRLPYWMRRFTPWWVLHFINRHTATCWPRMATWKLYGEDGIDESWCVSRSCWDGPNGGWDYCGRYQRREDMPLKQEVP